MLKKIAIAAIVGVSTFLIILFTSQSTVLLEGLENSLSDFWFYIRQPSPEPLSLAPNPYVSDRVKMVGIDDASLNVIGNWPWYRDVHATYLSHLQQYSPKAVHFDIAFVSHSEAPVYFKRKFENDPQTLRRVDDAYRGMDNTFTAELSKYNNVYIDLFLQKEDRAEASFADRIRVTEKAMERFSQSAQGELAPYHSMEPLIEEYARNARPVPVNVEPDRDSKVRSFPLAFTISNSDGMVRKYFSIVMSMLMEYYRVPQEFVSIQKDKIILNAARVPSLNKKTRQQLVKEVPLEKVTGKLAGRSKNERYNRNLYQLIVNDFSLVYADDPDKVPYFPVQLLVKDGKFEVLDGQEILDAAIAVGSKKIKIVEYTEKDVVIRTGFTFFPHTFLINYGAKDEQGYKDPATGRPVNYKAIPTVSYNDIYSMDRLPEIPGLGGDKRIAGSYDTTYLKDWFFNTQLRKQIPKFQRAVFNKYKAYDGDKALEYASKEDPFLGKYYLYKLYLENVSPVPASMAGLEASYASFIKEYGLTQDKDQYLSEKNILAALQENYSDRFGQYYNKFIFTGVNGTGAAHDIHETPLGKMFGINAIIYAFSTIVTENQLSKSTTGWDIFYLLILCLALGVAYSLVDIRIGSFIVILSFFGTLILSYLSFDMWNYSLKTIPLAAANLVIFIAVTVYKVLTEEKDKKFLKATFSSYLAPELIDQMYETKTMPKLGGDERVNTAFFTDIQGFSTFSEKLTAEQLVELLNEYLGSMTDILLSEKGTLDKYIGDAIIGIFGAPMPLPDHAIRACRVAIGMQANLGRLRAKWAEEKVELVDGKNPRNVKNLPVEDWPVDAKWPRIVWDMRVRVGVNTGNMVTGNMGSTMRMNYTMMGDPVNLAARLEAGAKQFGVYTLVSDATLDYSWKDETGNEVKTLDFVEARFIDKITVVGKSEPVEVFEVVALKGQLTPAEQELFTLFKEGVKHYQNTEWDKALEIFKKTKAMELFPKNKFTPSIMYIERCEEYKVNPPVPPGQKWDGVFRMTQKH